MWAGPSCFLSSGDGYVGELLELQQGPFEFPEFRCDEPPDASEEMGLISPGGENLLDFLELGRVSRVKTGTSGTRSGGLRKGQPHASCLGSSRDSSPLDAGP